MKTFEPFLSLTTNLRRICKLQICAIPRRIRHYHLSRVKTILQVSPSDPSYHNICRLQFDGNLFEIQILILYVRIPKVEIYICSALNCFLQKSQIICSNISTAGFNTGNNFRKQWFCSKDRSKCILATSLYFLSGRRGQMVWFNPS
jgi:hypothetical protein